MEGSPTRGCPPCTCETKGVLFSPPPPAISADSTGLINGERSEPFFFAPQAKKNFTGERSEPDFLRRRGAKTKMFTSEPVFLRRRQNFFGILDGSDAIFMSRVDFFFVYAEGQSWPTH